MPIVGRCICCGMELVGEREAVRCSECQRTGRWPRGDDPDRAVLDAAVVDVPPHRLRPGFRLVTHAEGLRLLGLVDDLTPAEDGRMMDSP